MMEVIEITEGASFAGAVELPNSTRRTTYKSVGGKGGGTGSRKTGSVVPPVTAAGKKRDREISEANRRVLVISPEGKTWVLLSDYRLAHPA
jgi:hypothetical protein